MNFLLTNDDGYKNPYFEQTKEALKKYGEVYVSAPMVQRSGASCSLKLDGPKKVLYLDDKSIAIDGTPADCVSMGLEYFKNVKFDYVVSGTNEGLNISYDTIFSGTVGAVLVASSLGLKGLALSACFNETPSQVYNKTIDALDFVFKNNLFEHAIILSINYPIKEYEKGLGFKLGHIYNSPTIDFVKFDGELVDSERLYSIKRGVLKDSDAYYTNSGYYSITPLSITYEDNKQSKILEKVLEELN